MNKTLGQIAYEAFVGSYKKDCKPWHRLTKANRQSFDAAAGAVAARLVTKPAAPKPAIVTHGGLEHGDVVVFTGQQDDCTPRIVAKVGFTAGIATLRLFDPRTKKTLDGIDFSRVRKINPAHLAPTTEVVVAPTPAKGKG